LTLYKIFYFYQFVFQEIISKTNSDFRNAIEK
jgi:hypothetical protein